MNQDYTVMALERYGEELQDLPGVQGVGADSSGLIVYVDDEASVSDEIPGEVIVVTGSGCEVSVAVQVRVIGTLTLE
jgi:hypothetical protein